MPRHRAFEQCRFRHYKMIKVHGQVLRRKCWRGELGTHKAGQPDAVVGIQACTQHVG